MNYANALAMGGATLITAAALALTATPLHGRPSKPVVITGEQQDAVTTRVTYADLNLASAVGERALNRRVSFAVQDVCGEAVGQSDIWMMHYCSVDAWKGARPQIATAVQRAREMAFTGSSTIAAASAITFSVRN